MRAHLLALILAFCSAHAVLAEEPRAAQSSSRASELVARQRELLVQARGAQTSSAASSPRGLDMEAAAALARQEKVVDKMLRDYSARPRKAIISSRTKEPRLAQYAEDWRQRVEAAGNQNFPRDEQGSLYGSVMLVVEINPDGSLASAVVQSPSPNPKLNEAALRIVQQAAPFAPMSAELRKDYDLLVITRTLSFKRDNGPAPSVQ